MLRRERKAEWNMQNQRVDWRRFQDKREAVTLRAREMGDRAEVRWTVKEWEERREAGEQEG